MDLKSLGMPGNGPTSHCGKEKPLLNAAIKGKSVFPRTCLFIVILARHCFALDFLAFHKTIDFNEII